MLQLDTPSSIVLGTLVYAFLLTFLGYFRLLFSKKFINDPDFIPAQVRLTRCMGKGHWSFNNSWATTLTAVGAFLGTVLSANGLTKQEKNIGLSLFFGVVGLLAPFVYSAVSKHRDIDTEDQQAGEGPGEFQGFIGTFLLSCWLTLWAVCGELMTLSVMLTDLVADNYLTIQISIIFLFLLFGALLLAFFYAMGTIPWTIYDQTTEFKKKQQSISDKRKIEPERVKDIHPSLSNWPFL
jgi:hypothetical protein